MEKTIQSYFDKQSKYLKNKFTSSEYYTNREMSWMEFNKRIIHLTLNKEIPLLERCKFLAISSSNLDEFIMVRFASIINKVYNSPNITDISGMSPMEEFNKILKEICEFKKVQQQTFGSLVSKLYKNDITISRVDKLTSKEKGFINTYFHRNIYPLLTPVLYDTTKEVPLIRSKKLSLIVSLADSYSSHLNVISIIPIENLERVIEVPTDNGDKKFVLVEDIIEANLNKIFVNKVVLYSGCFRIIREGDLSIDHNRDYYITDRMRQTLIEREFGTPVFMEVDKDIPKPILKTLIKIFGIDKKLVYKTKGVLDYSFFMTGKISNPVLEYDKFIPQYPEELIGEKNMFDAIDDGDILLSHPYESYDPVIKLLENASHDRDVLAIKQTLYRVSSVDSPIVESLCRAAKNGIQVSVLLEIKARFDEDQNLQLIDKLKMAGCKLIFGFEELKTHCKMLVVVKRNKSGMKIYSHIGTGNYNDKTAKIYTDISYFTSTRKIGEDLISIFNILSGYSDTSTKLNKLFISPDNIRFQFYKLIDEQIELAANGKDATITLKMNAICDKGIIGKLYEASEAGVFIDIVCRGICSMKVINDNIRIKSVVGRFLEHSRIYRFGNDTNFKIFISSADLLTRNLDKRVEILTPITETNCKNKLDKILKQTLADRFNSYGINYDNKYIKIRGSVDSQYNQITLAVNNYKLRTIPKSLL